MSVSPGQANDGEKDGVVHTDWAQKLDRVHIPKSDMNALVLNFLIVEGYESAAEEFAREANLNPSASINTITKRMSIRNAIFRGDVKSAIEQINDFDPEVLDTNASLHFQLLRLELIELIRSTLTPNNTFQDITHCLEFAMSHLASRAPSNPAFLQDLEQTMALLCFPQNNIAPQLAPLLKPELRRQVANNVNSALLESQGERKESNIRGLIRLWDWGERRLRKENFDFPGLRLAEN